MTISQIIPFNSRLKQLNSYINDIETHFKRPFLISYPQTLFIEVTNHCNLSCEICARNYWDNDKNKLGYFPFVLLRKMISFLKHSRLTILNGHGEPLLATHVWDIARVCYRYGNRTLFTTNGVLLDHENRKRVLASYINEIRLSVDGSDEATLQKNRGVSFDLIMSNFNEMARLRDSVNSSIPHLGLSITLMKSTIEQIPELIRLCEKYNFQFIHLQKLKIYSPALKHESLFLYPDYYVQQLKKIKKEAYKRNIEIRCDEHETDTCSQPFRSLIIQWNGTVRYCCSAIFENNGYSFSGGSLFDHSLRSLWNSSIAQNIRNGFRNNDPIAACSHCAFISNDLLSHIRSLDE